MSGLAASLDAFHFIRPLWLLLLPIIAVLWWAVRRAGTRRERLPDGLASHLRAALTLGATGRRRPRPIDGVALVLALAAVGAAGPTWSRLADPFVAQSAPVVVVLEVTPSMAADDLAPSRLERGKQKIRDLLALRAGAPTALIAYAGSAHVVVPMAEDPSVLLPYLEGLTPDVMPEPGAVAGEAQGLAEALLATQAMPGAVLFVADGMDPADAPTLEQAQMPPVILAMLPDGVRDRGLDALSLKVIRATPDPGDVRQIDRLLDAEYREAMRKDSAQPWQDRGPWLAWPAALLVLLWFRRGWTMRWPLMAVLALGLAPPEPARAEGLVDWFLTPDQQGQIAYSKQDYHRAAERFADPLWRGLALYRDGQYPAAVEVLERLDTAQAAFIQGMAQIRSRGYRDAVRAFETTLERDPDYPHAAENLATAREILEYVERVREQSDTSEEAGIGADEVVFDNEAARGQDTTMEVPRGGDGEGPLSTEQWMRTVDTRTEDFLRARFALEAAQAKPAPAANQTAGGDPAPDREPGPAPDQTSAQTPDQNPAQTPAQAPGEASQ